MSIRPSTFSGLILIALLTLCWGINWPIMKVGLADIPVFTFRGSCVLFGGVGLLAIAWLAGGPVMPRRREVMPLIWLSLFNVLIWQVLSGYGVAWMAAGRAAVLAYTMPCWAVVLGALVLKERIDWKRGVGLALGVSGMALLVGDDLSAVGRAPLGAAFTLAAALAWAIGTVLAKRYRWELPLSAMVGWQLLLSAPPMLAVALAFEIDGIGAVGWPATWSLLYNMVFATLAAHWLWFRILEIYPAGVASISTLSIPVVGLFTGAALLGEPLGWLELGALALVVAALAAVHGDALRAALFARIR